MHCTFTIDDQSILSQITLDSWKIVIKIQTVYDFVRIYDFQTIPKFYNFVSRVKM